MEELFGQYMQSPYHWGLLFFCALLIGMSKTGIQGINTISIPLMAIAFGAKESTGIILPMLCIADLFAVAYYRRNAKWEYVFKLLPAAIIGFFAAIAVDRFMPETAFKYLMAFCIFGGLIVMYWNSKNRQNAEKLASSPVYSSAFGFAGGFSTMIGNAAGPVMAVYMLSANLPKLAFVGTNAWFFLTVNYLKIPLQIFAWDNIRLSFFYLNLICIPFILFGALLGVLFIKIVPEKFFRIFIVASTVISTFAMLLM